MHAQCIVLALKHLLALVRACIVMMACVRDAHEPDASWLHSVGLAVGPLCGILFSWLTGILAKEKTGDQSSQWVILR